MTAGFRSIDEISAKSCWDSIGFSKYGPSMPVSCKPVPMKTRIGVGVRLEICSTSASGRNPGRAMSAITNPGDAYSMVSTSVPKS